MAAEYNDQVQALDALTEGLRQNWKKDEMVKRVEADMRRQREELGTTFYIGEDSMGGLRHPDINIDQVLIPKVILTPPAQIRFYRRRQMRRISRSGK